MNFKKKNSNSLMNEPKNTLSGTPKLDIIKIYCLFKKPGLYTAGEQISRVLC